MSKEIASSFSSLISLEHLTNLREQFYHLEEDHGLEWKWHFCFLTGFLLLLLACLLACLFVGLMGSHLALNLSFWFSCLCLEGWDYGPAHPLHGELGMACCMAGILSTNRVTSPALRVIFLKVLPISSRMQISTLGNECKTGGGKAASQVHGEQPDGNPASRFQPEVLAGSVDNDVAHTLNLPLRHP